MIVSDTYRVTIDAFLADGGDAFSALVSGSARVAGPLDRDVLDAYVTARSPLSPAPLNRIARVH